VGDSSNIINKPKSGQQNGLEVGDGDQDASEEDKEPGTAAGEGAGGEGLSAL